MFTTCCEIFTNVKFSEKIKADFDEILFVTTFATTKKTLCHEKKPLSVDFPIISSAFKLPFKPQNAISGRF